MGSAVGTICAPNYAMIPIGEFERTYICPYIRSSVNSFCRIIDDLFLLWSGREIEFIAKFNTCHRTIKFDYKYS